MTLRLYLHPLSSYCHKVLIAFYENDTRFEPAIIDLGDPASRAALLKVWPIGKFPVLRDETRDRTIPESSTIIEYLDQHYPGRTRFVPADPDLARQARYHDRVFDLHVHHHMQSIIGDRLRPVGKKDPFGVDQAMGQLQTALDLIDKYMASRTWVMGDTFGIADCAAAPALFYVNKILPLADRHKSLDAYLARLMARPSYARVLKEAEPYFHMFPTA